MDKTSIVRVQTYLRNLFGTDRVFIDQPKKAGQPIEVRVGENFVGVLHSDDDEGEISYSLVISILEEDLPASVPPGGGGNRPARR